MTKKTAAARVRRNPALDYYAMREQERIEKTAAAKTQSKTKYTCPLCSVNAWAKPNVAIKCGVHDELMLIAPRANIVRKAVR